LNQSIFFPAASAGIEEPEDIGKKLFIHFCTQCHGEKGNGDGVTQNSLILKPGI
jgi:cytochrome c|tara:strand:+ start:148 stop:309 length:162 start_codon:yes stop_codon:yes gene_type:complete